jgi:hypothetical protein
MPKRSNAFQKLVHTIYRQLADGATVTESKELRDRITGKLREVDVVIETPVAGSPMVISVECASRSRRADVQWVEQLAKKHETLPTNQLVLVAEAGFARDARQKAQLLGIEALSLEAATATDWTEIVGKLSHLYMALFQTTTVACQAELSPEYGQSGFSPVGAAEVLYSALDQPLCTLDEFFRRALPRHLQDLMRQMTEDGEKSLLLGLACPLGSYLIDSSGIKRRIGVLHYQARIVRDHATPIELKHWSFRDAQVAHGSIDGPVGQGTLTIIERKGHSRVGEMTIKFPEDAFSLPVEPDEDTGAN